MIIRMKQSGSLFIAILLSLSSPIALAQVSTGTIAGTVRDGTGATAAGATVTITNTATGIITQSTTSNTGFYSVPNLQTGPYTVSITAAGFSKEIEQGIELNVGAQQEINFTLKVGAVSDKVVVTTTPPNIDLVTSTTMPIVNERTIVELPLNGRDWTQLANLQPGVAAVRTQPAVAVTNQRANRGIGNQLTVGGARPQQNNYRVDGISINDYSNGGPGGVIGSNLGVDAIQEFSVVTSNASADYGKSAGGIINAVSRSGTNQLHDSAYEFLRNSALDARNECDAPGQIAEFRRNQFGASAGGPILKGRTFIFGDYEGLRQYQGANTSSIVPSAAAHSGSLCVVAGSNPCANQTQVPVSAAVAPYVTFYPLPSSDPGPNSDTGSFLFNDPFTSHENYFTTRGDHRISDKDSLSGTYFYDNGNLVSPDDFNVRITGNIAKRQLATIGESHVFKANLLNSAKFGYSRVVSDPPSQRSFPPPRTPASASSPAFQLGSSTLEASPTSRVASMQPASFSSTSTPIRSTTTSTSPKANTLSRWALPSNACRTISSAHPTLTANTSSPVCRPFSPIIRPASTLHSPKASVPATFVNLSTAATSRTTTASPAI